MSRLRRRTLYLPHPGGRARPAQDTRAVVIGGGIAGVAAACALAERGVRVVLIEREAYLGGRAGGFAQTLADGERVLIERGFHRFHRHYYNLRALLRRVDPELRALSPLSEQPLYSGGGARRNFGNGGSGVAPLHPLRLAWRTPQLRVLDLLNGDARTAFELLRFHPERTYQQFDATSAGTYLAALGIPEHVQRALLAAFAHACLEADARMSAAELLMMIHFYFSGNPEGLACDVASSPLPRAFWRPFEQYLESLGARVCKATAARAVHKRDFGGYCVEHDAGRTECELLVLALDAGGLKHLLAHSPELPEGLARAVSQLERGRPQCVLRLWLDRELLPERPAFAGVSGVGALDRIALYDRFQDESAAWARKHRGSVVELHGTVQRCDDRAAIRADLLAGLHALYPEARSARVVDERLLLSHEGPAFPPGSHAQRPAPDSGVPDLALAGDFLRMPFPCAWMERAAASGLLAANLLLAPLGVAPHPIRSIPNHGLLAPLRATRSHALGITHAR
jgi:isorenieratene synthase